MRRPIVCAFLLLALSSVSGAQPWHGDLILTLNDSRTWQWGVVVVMNPRSGKWTTLAGPFTPEYLATVRMAPDNQSVVVPKEVAPAGWPGHILEIAPGGARTTLATIHDGGPEGILLDHDDTWITVGSVWQPASRPNCVWSLGHRSRTLTTLFINPRSGTGWYNDVGIWREQGRHPYPYAIGVGNNPTTQSRPSLLFADRSGVRSTLVQGSGPPLPQVTAVELDPRLGDFLVTGYWSIWQVTAGGKITSLPTSFAGGNAAHINQDGTSWVTDSTVRTSGSVTIYKIAANGVVVTMLPMAAYPAPSFTLTGIEVYGGRPLVCDQKSTATVTVNVHSLHPVAGGRLYALAASLARRPGIGPFSNGEYLNLDATDPLFYLSALGMLPSVFRNFQGTLDPFGNATARVDWSSLGLPPNLGITVFVAGLIFDPRSGIIQVTNTHWFVL